MSELFEVQHALIRKLQQHITELESATVFAAWLAEKGTSRFYHRPDLTQNHLDNLVAAGWRLTKLYKKGEGK